MVITAATGVRDGEEDKNEEDVNRDCYAVVTVEWVLFVRWWN